MVNFPGGSAVKKPTASAGDVGLIPGLGTSLEEEIATHSRILAWRIPWTEGLGGCSLWGHKRVSCELGTKQQKRE